MGNDTSASKIVLEYVCPVLGTLTANVMFVAPVRDVYLAVRAGRGLGRLNPTPWAFMLGNTMGWVTYGLMLRNPFVILANAPGLLSSIWLNLQAAKLMYESVRSRALLASIVQALSTADQQDQYSAPSTSLRRSDSNNVASPRSSLPPLSQEQLLAAAHEEKKNHPAGVMSEYQPVTPNMQQHGEGDVPMVDHPIASGNNHKEESTYNNAGNDTVQVTNHADRAAVVLLATIQAGGEELSVPDLAPPSSHDGLVIGNVLLWMIVVSVLIFGEVSADRQQFVVGLITNCLLVIFYGGPLSTIKQVITSRNAASIHGPTMVTNTLNGIFWAAYGFAVSDYFISVPNSLGAVLGGIQFVLYVAFPRTLATPDDNAVERTNKGIKNTPAVEAAAEP
jgi:Sugar efflux transporter for intercellular exchange